MLDETQVMSAVESALEAFGRLDVVQNNVGQVRLGGPEELTLAEWRAAVAINLDTVFLGAKATLAHLVETRGSMINVSSTGSIRWTGYPYSGYAASKAAVNQLTRSLALEYADRGVRVNAILPGLIDTPLVYRELSEGHDVATVRADARGPQSHRRDGHGAGRGERRAVSGVRRVRVRDWHTAAGGRWPARPGHLIGWRRRRGNAAAAAPVPATTGRIAFADREVTPRIGEEQGHQVA